MNHYCLYYTSFVFFFFLLFSLLLFYFTLSVILLFLLPLIEIFSYDASFCPLGPVFYEALMSDKAGSLHMITDLLEGIRPDEIKQILKEKLPDLSRVSKKYWLERGLKHIFPLGRLSELGLSRLNALKYKIVGTFVVFDLYVMLLHLFLYYY